MYNIDEPSYEELKTAFGNAMAKTYGLEGALAKANKRAHEANTRADEAEKQIKVWKEKHDEMDRRMAAFIVRFKNMAREL